MKTLDAIMGMAVSWCVTALVSYLLFWCFRLPWDLRTATGVWTTLICVGVYVNILRK